MKIFVIRHGQTTANIGQPNGELESNIPLTLEGVKQCKKAGHDLKVFCDKNNINIADATVFYSPFLRTQHTGQFICDEIGASKFIPEQRLTERDFGIFATHEYHKWPLINAAENAKYLQSLESPYSAFFHKLPNGESVQDCYLRIDPFAEKLKQIAKEESPKQPEQVFVIITHRITGKVFLQKMINEDVIWYASTKDMPNCEVMYINNDTPDNSFAYSFLSGFNIMDDAKFKENQRYKPALKSPSSTSPIKQENFTSNFGLVELSTSTEKDGKKTNPLNQ